MTLPGAVLEVSDACLAFGGNRALDSISFTLSKGEILGLIGPNGSGKTTLLNVIGGLYRLQLGSIHFEGQRIDRTPVHEVARAGIARTFQVPRVFARMTALENMLVPAYTSGEGGETDHRALLARARELLAFVQIDELADDKAGNLSGGQSMLLQFARALMLRPRLMLLDEPFSGVHPLLIKRMSERIEELHGQGIDFVVVSHDLPAIMGLSSRIVVLANGRVIADGAPEAVRHDPEVIEAYLGI